MSSEPTPSTHNPRLALTEARQRRRWSQLDLAQKLGTTQANVSRWERGITTPGPFFRNKLRQLFRLSDQDLDLGRARSPLAMAEIEHMLYDPAIPDRSSIALVGRDRDLVLVKQRLLRGQPVGLHGMPGVGKTALASELANDRQVWEYFSEGVLWAGIGIKPNIVAILSRWGALLGVPASEGGRLASSEAWSYALRSTIEARRFLIVLDDVWQLKDALSLKVGGPSCAYLLTTRIPTVALQFAPGGTTVLRELADEEGLALLAALAPRVVESEAELAHNLARAVGGLPLALTLMGHYLRTQAHHEQPRRIRAALAHLSDTELRLRLTDHQVQQKPAQTQHVQATITLESVIAASEEQLEPQAIAALRALAVFPAKPNSFSEAAALAVAACSTTILDTLVDAGLVEVVGRERYSVHPTIADYARSHRKDRRASERLIAYGIEYAQAHTTDHQALDQESSSLFAALDAAYELEEPALAEGVLAVTPFLLARGFYPLMATYLRRAEMATRKTDDSFSLARVLLYLGQTSWLQGEYVPAEAYLQEGLSLARQTADDNLISNLLKELGAVYAKRGMYTQAEAVLLDGLALARQCASDTLVCSILMSLGAVAGEQGDFTQAHSCYAEGLAVAKGAGLRELLSGLLTGLGLTADLRGDAIQAETHYQEGLALARSMHQQERISLLLTNLGELAMHQGALAQAEIYYQEGLALARSMHQQERISLLLAYLGELAMHQGTLAQAETHCQEGLALARRIENSWLTCYTLGVHGDLLLQQQHLDAAEAAFREMLASVPLGSQDLCARAQFGLARVLSAQGELGEARQLGVASFETFTREGHRDALTVSRWLDALAGEATQARARKGSRSDIGGE